MDLSAAFDLVDHQLLLKKLGIYGVKGDFMEWIKSYLSERFQSVWIDHILSSSVHCEFGVPQGSILGPLFFLIFSNDLPAQLDSHADAYADDTTLTASGYTISEVEQTLNRDCATVSNWMKSNLQKLNADKCHILTMGTRHKLNSINRLIEVKIDGVALGVTQSETLLGCNIQEDLKWHDQVDALTKRLTIRLNALSLLRYCCPYSIKKSIAEAIFTSVLAYCIPVFGGLDKNSIHSLQIIQNKAARIVCQAPSYAKRSLMYEKLGWLTLNQLISYHTLLTIHKIRVSREPKYLANYLTIDSRNGRIMVPNQMLSISLKSFCFRGTDQWNLLPYSMRIENNFKPFKKKLKEWTLTNIPMFLD